MAELLQLFKNMGANCSSENSTVDAVVTVRTGDVKGGGTDGNVFIALHDIKGNRTRDVLLDCRWKNDFEAGSLDTFKISDARLPNDVKEIEIWRDDSMKVDDWFVEVITVDIIGEPTKFVFPVQRWVNAGDRLFLTPYDSCLPQFEQHTDQRTRLLNLKRQLYQYKQNVEGLPVQGKDLPRDEQFSNDYRHDIMKRKLVLIAQSKIVNMTSDKWRSLDDLKNVYKNNLGPPKGMNYWKEDLNFGEQRLMGCNPTLFKLCSEIPENFGVTAEMLEPHLEGLSLEDALGAKRLYIVDLTFLEGTKCKNDRTMTAPYALLFVNKDKDLMPIAIQLFPMKGPDNPVFLPSDHEYTWMMAKMWYNMADCSYHQSCTHLGLTHLIAESCAICTHRQLSASHPMFRLMAPHFLYLLAINTLALDRLVCPDGWIDKTMQMGREGLFNIVKKVWKDWRLDVQGTLPAELKNRGVEDVEALPNYPYRDDALPIWNAINTYVRKVVEATYDVPAKIAEDHELQAWVRELGGPQSEGGCEIKGVPGGGKFATVDEIVATVTSIIFICSVSHAAANFAQYDEYAFPPNYPAFMHGEPPKTKDPLTEQDIISALPDKSHTLDIMVVTKILSDRGTQPLGDFERQYMYDPIGVKAWKEFCQELATISQESSERDKARKTSYPYLNPTEIPNAISI
ncbi:polyunsaturated fatty acid 5-lipoxygenase-like [Branchiostoma floridae]|uniref:Polyunsaturated fatty acid 5-lipoxygenase-like n=1 Tax=Branchiostoma floridae TaxID=7739 RepID=A0A9J7LTX1_BRAFL|nr:polyunsaturated fatty acid 5-lipoxygenase-like [Branchiostoma floridae]